MDSASGRDSRRRVTANRLQKVLPVNVSEVKKQQTNSTRQFCFWFSDKFDNVTFDGGSAMLQHFVFHSLPTLDAQFQIAYVGRAVIADRCHFFGCFDIVRDIRLRDSRFVYFSNLDAGNG